MGIVEETLTAQGVIQPGTEGFWRVYGARAQDIRTGDLVLTKTFEFEVREASPYGDIRDIVIPRFIGTDGETYSIGALMPIMVLRRGTKHTLADSI